MPHAPLLPMALHNLVHVCHACACAWGVSTRAPTAAQPAPWPPGLGARMRAAAERAQASAAARRALHGSSAARRRPCGGCRPRSRRPGSPGRPRERALRGIVGPARVLWTGLARDVSARARAISGLGWAAQLLRYATCRRGVWWRGSPVAEVVAIGSIDAGLSLSKLPRSGAATGIAAAAPAAADSSSCGRRNELGQQGSWRWVLPSTVHEAASHARWHMGRWWVGDVPDSVAPPSVRVAE